MLRKKLSAFAVALVVLAVTGVAAQAGNEKADLRNELGITYAKEGHYEDALRNFTMILAEFPDHAAALNNSANIYFVQGEVERARKMYDRAIAAYGQEGGIYFNLGILQHSVGESEASAASVRKGFDLIGDPHEAYYMLGLSQQAPGASSRASDTGADLQSAEIEKLLAAAMADIPTAGKDKAATTAKTTDDKTEKPKQTAAAEQSPSTVATRPGGAKASQASDGNVVSERLFWMSAPEKP